MRSLLIALAIAALVVGVPATGSIGGPAAVAKLGSVIPLTGRYGGGGAQVRAGYELAVDDINRAGGVQVGSQRVQLQLSILDDESNPTLNVTRVETLAGQGVVALLGGFASDMHAAAAPVAEKDKIPYCGVAFALHAIHEHGFRHLFSPFPKSPDLGRETYRMLNASIAADQRPRRVAIFQERTDWGREMGDVWTSRSREYGYQIVLRAQYT